MTTPKRLTRTYLALTAGLLVLFGMNLLWGSVSLTPQAVLAALLGKGQEALFRPFRSAGVRMAVALV